MGRKAPSRRQARPPHHRRGRSMAGSRGASEAKEAMPDWWPAAIAKGRGSISGRTLAAAARAVGATKTLWAFLCYFNSTFMHSLEPVFAIINQEVEQGIRHVDFVIQHIFMYLPTFKLMMLVSNKKCLTNYFQKIKSRDIILFFSVALKISRGRTSH
jgi:hypothetical protein